MATILRKPVPPPRTHSHAQAYSYAAAPSISDDDQLIVHTTPSSYSDNLEPATTRETSDKLEVASKVKEYEVIEHEKTSPWGIHWYSPALMLGLFSVGIGTSIAHHIFYDSLDGKDVGTTMAQEWAIRIGTGMAFIIKASLAAAVGVGYTQRLWVTLKKKAITLQAVDDLFLLTMTPTSFFSWEVLRKAKLLCFMAASMWCIPIVATITPATLSISPTSAQTMRDVIVPFLDFAPESSKLYYVESPDTVYTPPGTPKGGMMGPSVFMKQLLSAVSMGGRVLHTPPQSSNSTYHLEFFGPSLKCYNLTTPAGNNATDAKAPANNPAEQEEVELLRPMHRLVMTHFEVATDFNGGKAGWLYWGFSGVLSDEFVIPGYADRYPPDYTGYEELEEPARMLDTLHIYLRPDYNQTVEPYGGISCMLWNTSYTVLFSSQGAEQSTSITRLARTEEVHINGSMSAGNFTFSQRAYKGYSEALLELLTGSLSTAESLLRDYTHTSDLMSMADSACNIGPKELMSTTLAYCPEFNPLYNGTGRRENPTMCRNGTLLQAIEDLSLNVTLSLLSSPDLSGNTTVTAKFFTAVNRYSYNWQNLALAYGVGILVALVCISIGAYSYFTNGYSASMSFSSIIFTTRNPDLDRISEGRCFPALPLGPELGKIKLRYGMLRSGDRVGHEHAAFGFSSTIRELKKGAKCV